MSLLSKAVEMAEQCQENFNNLSNIIVEAIKKYPNDDDLGRHIREIFANFKSKK